MDDSRIREFVEGSYARVVGAVTLVCGDRHAAEDAVQESLITAWSRIDDLESLGGWVLAASLNRIRSRFRRRASEARAYARWTWSAERPAFVDDAPDEKLAVALAALPGRQREVVVLHYFADLSVAEVAETLSVSEGTVKTCLHRARLRLRETLNQPNEEEARRA